MSLTKIGSIGINTGIQLAGVTTVSTLHVGSGVTLSSDGDGFFTGITSFTRNVTGDYAVKISNTHATGQGLNIRGGSANGQYALLVEDYAATNLFEINGDGEVEVKTNHLRANHGVVVTGIVTASSFAGSGANLTGIDTDLVNDTSPQLGGNLDVNTKNIVFGDSGGATDDRLTFGAGTDLSIYHGSNISTVIDTYGDLRIMSDTIRMQRQAGGENFIYMTEGGTVRLHYDGLNKLETTSTGITVTGAVNASSVTLGDNNKAFFGTGSDLEIFHDGTDSILKDTRNSGTFRIQADSIGFNDKDVSETMLLATADGSVNLYYNGSKKFETTSSGISVTGGGTFTNTVHCNSDDDTRLRLNVPSGNSDDWNYIGFYGEDGARDGFLGAWSDGTMSFYDDNNDHYIRFMDSVLKTNASYVPVANNSVDLGTTSLLWRDAFLAGGIYLGGTAAANKLYDYEKGTFTPRFHGQGNNNTITTSVNVGEYVRIGRLVHVKLYVQFSNRNGANSVLAMDGLPFSNAGNYTAIPLGRWTNMQNCPVIGALTGHIGDGSTEITFHEIQQGGASTSDVNRTTDTTSVMLNFSYPVWNG